MKQGFVCLACTVALATLDIFRDDNVIEKNRALAAHMGKALAMSGDVEDRKLAGAIAAFINEMPISQATAPQLVGPERAPKREPVDIGPQK